MQAIVKKDGMIKSIMGYKMVDHKDVEQILMQLKSCARQHPGFVDAEFLVSEGDQSVGLMISTWESTENWKTWVGSKGTEALLREAGIAVMGAARLTAYRIVPGQSRANKAAVFACTELSVIVPKGIIEPQR